MLCRGREGGDKDGEREVINRRFANKRKEKCQGYNLNWRLFPPFSILPHTHNKEHKRNPILHLPLIPPELFSLSLSLSICLCRCCARMQKKEKYLPPLSTSNKYKIYCSNYSISFPFHVPSPTPCVRVWSFLISLTAKYVDS